MNKEEVLSKLKTRFSGKKVLVLGLGREGKASLKFILENYTALGVDSLGVADQNVEVCRNCVLKAKQTYNLSVQDFSGPDYLKSMAQFDLVLKSPGISFKGLEYLPAPEHTRKLASLKAAPKTEISCQVDLFLQLYGEQTVTVSGTKGKSTTTTLIKELLAITGFDSVLLGNIGIAAFEQIFSLESKVAALELSCHQLEFTCHASSVALLTNFYPEHLDHYHSLAEYYQVKLNLLKFAKPGQIVVLPAYEPILLELALAELKKEQRVFFLCRNLTDLQNLQKLYEDMKVPATAFAFYYDLTNKELTLLGQLDQANAKTEKLKLAFSKQLEVVHIQLDSILAVIATFAHSCIDYERTNNSSLNTSLLKKLWAKFSQTKVAGINQCLKNFIGLEHRLQYVGTYRTHQVYNDSISTIPLAAIKALQALPNCQTIILGGLDRGLDYSSLIDFLKDKKVNVIALKDTGWKIVDCLQNLGAKTKAIKVENMHAAVKLAYEITEADRGILLSPAAASYNTYKDFTERGLDFVNEIKQQAERIQAW